MPDEAPSIDRKNCWIDSVAVNQAKAVASHRGETISEVLERHLNRPALAKEFAAAVEAINQPAKAGA